MSALDFQDAVHQAVDIGFSIADLLGGLFADKSYQHVLHTNAAGSQITLSLNSDNQPILSCTGPDTTFAVVAPTTTQSQATPVQGQVAGQPFVIQGGTQILFTNFPNFTRGMITATQVDGTQAIPPLGLPVAAATLRDFSDAESVPLLTQTTNDSSGQPTVIPLISLSVGSNAFTVYNADEQNPYGFAATITTTSPNRTFTLANGVGAGGQTTTPFPDNIGTAVIEQMSIVMNAVPNESYVMSPTPGAQPIPPSAKRR